MLSRRINRLLFEAIDTGTPAKHTGYFLSAPRVVIFEATNRCDVTCEFCLRHHFKDERPRLSFGEIDPGLVHRVLGEMRHTVEFVGLNGFGEPLLHSDFPGLVAAARAAAPGAEIGFHTNGVRLRPDRLMPAFLRHGVGSISVSVDAVDRESYCRLHRGRDHFDRIISQMRECLAMAARAGNRPRFSMTYTVVPGNEAALVRFVQLAASLGIATAGPVHVVNEYWARDTYAAPPDFADRVRAALGAAETEARRLGVELLKPDTDSRKPGSMGVDHITSHACAWPIKYAPLIDWQGNVLLCCWRPSPDDYTLGNLRDRPLSSIWNGLAFRRLRRAMAAGRLPAGCNDCRMLGFPVDRLPEFPLGIPPRYPYAVSP